MYADAAISAPYGTWRSPITTHLLADKSVTLDDLVVDHTTSTIYHVERRPADHGRNAIVHSGSKKDLLGKGWNARTTVQEYGGTASVIHDGTVIFSNFTDGQVYILDLNSNGTPKRITSNTAHRFADFTVHPRYPRFVVCILEDHTYDQPSSVVSSLVVIDLQSTSPNPVTELLSGADFYSNPRFNDDGIFLAWSQWDHPDMPWDGSQVFVAAIASSEDSICLSPQILPPTALAGMTKTISAVQPTWVNPETLLFSCDESGYQNPWMSCLIALSDGTYTVSTHPLLSESIVSDFSDPSWWLGCSNIAVIDPQSALFSVPKAGRHLFAVVHLDGRLKEINSPYVQAVRLHSVSTRKVAFFGTKIDEPQELIVCVFDEDYVPTYSTIETRSTAINLRPFISHPESIYLFKHLPGEAYITPIHLIFYPPHNPNYAPSKEEKPCAIVNVHGGPAWREGQGLDMEKQYFTSRGWAWIDVNHSGSSTYGRGYRDRLKGNWGITDVEECAYVAQALSSFPYDLIDPKRIVIRGRSAGGYTVLRSLSGHGLPAKVFAAGTSSSGISDLKSLALTTHKFQSHYAAALMGGTYTQKPDAYHDRSPLFQAHKIKKPLLIIQGSIDQIVRRDQSRAMVDVIKKNGGEVEYIEFEGEGHGWRQAKNIQSALEAELRFYERVFDLGARSN